MATEKGVGQEISTFGGDSLLRSGVAGLSGGLGAGLRRATDAATGRAVNASAKRLADRVGRRGNGGEGDSGAGTGENKKMLGGLSFYTVLLIAILKDVSDIFADLSVILSALTPITSIIVSFVVAFYLYTSKVEMSSNKMVMYIVSLVIEFVPILNAIPTTTVVLYLTKYLENKRRRATGGGSSITRARQGVSPSKPEGVTRQRFGSSTTSG